MTSGGVAVRGSCLFVTSGGAGLAFGWIGRGNAIGCGLESEKAHGGSALSAQPGGTVILRVRLQMFGRSEFGCSCNRRLGVLQANPLARKTKSRLRARQHFASRLRHISG